MTPSELRAWVQIEQRSIPVKLIKLVDKLTDPTPIDDAFAESLCRGFRNVEIGNGDENLVFPLYSPYGDWDVRTRGDVYTLLWQAGLLEQLEGE